jgi:hypothetical protein
MRASNKTKKLQNYNLLEAFVQCDFVDGFAYIDKAGAIVNIFAREKKEVPNFSMGLSGLSITDVSSTIPELRVSSNRIWIHFVEPKNLGNVSNQASELFKKILDILKPTIYGRIGWRTYFARDDISSEDNPFRKLKIGEGEATFDIQNAVLTKKISEFQTRLEVSPIAKATDPSKKSLLFDIDIAKAAKKIDVKENLEEIRATLRSEELLDALEELIKNG